MDQIAYFRLRAEQNRALAQKAALSETKEFHLDLAKHYDMLVSELDRMPSSIKITLPEQ